jgi:hypothetical protein
MYSDNPQSVLTRPNKGGTMTRGGQTTVIKPGMPTVGGTGARGATPAAPPRAAGRSVLLPPSGPMALGSFTGAKPSAAAPAAPAAPAPATPNKGGTMTTQVAPGVRATVIKPPTPAASTAANRPNAGGTMVRGGVTTVIPPGQPTAASAVATRAPTAAPTAPPAAAAATPAPSTTPAGAAASAPPPPAAQNLGFSSRGSMAPTGTDAQPGDANVGGTGLYSKRFSSPASAKIYGDYVSRIFGGNQPNKAPASGVIASPTSAAEPKPTVDE